MRASRLRRGHRVSAALAALSLHPIRRSARQHACCSPPLGHVVDLGKGGPSMLGNPTSSPKRAQRVDKSRWVRRRARKLAASTKTLLGSINSRRLSLRSQRQAKELTGGLPSDTQQARSATDVREAGALNREMRSLLLRMEGHLAELAGHTRAQAPGSGEEGVSVTSRRGAPWKNLGSM